MPTPRFVPTMPWLGSVVRSILSSLLKGMSDSRFSYTDDNDDTAKATWITFNIQVCSGLSIEITFNRNGMAALVYKETSAYNTCDLQDQNGTWIDVLDFTFVLISLFGHPYGKKHERLDQLKAVISKLKPLAKPAVIGYRLSEPGQVTVESGQGVMQSDLCVDLVLIGGTGTQYETNARVLLWRDDIKLTGWAQKRKWEEEKIENLSPDFICFSSNMDLNATRLALRDHDVVWLWES